MKQRIVSFSGLLLAAAILLVACNKEDNGTLKDTPIIEAYLMAESTLLFTVTHQVAFDTEDAQVLNDFNLLEITVTVNQTRYTLTPLGDGNYTDTTLKVQAGDNVSFSFTLNGETITGDTYIPTKPVILSQSTTSVYVDKVEIDEDGRPINTGAPSAPGDPIEITWENTDGSFYLMVIENMETDPEPVRDFLEGEEPPVRNFLKAPTNSASEQIRDQEFQYFGTHRLVLYHVLPDYADLYDEISSTSQNLTNPSSNISNTYGIFTGLHSDTLFLEVRES